MRPVILIILDGWGVSPAKEGNAIFKARTPAVDEIEKNYPLTTLQSAGIGVGLPWGEPGNSEVGHVAIGTGKIVPHYLTRIIKAIYDGVFFENKAFKEAIRYTKNNNSKLHLMGLIGSGSVHSYIDHFYALLDLAKREGAKEVKIHLFTDGKDSPPHQGATLIKNIKERVDSLGLGEISSFMGRMYAMDRDKRWDNTKAAFDCLTQGKGETSNDIADTIKKYYDKGLTDENLKPTVVVNTAGKPVGPIEEGDSVIFFNFREDSARQLTQAFLLPEEKTFPHKLVSDIFFVTMTQYDKSYPAHVAFPPIIIEWPLGRILAQNNKKQFRIAESEKYAHITYFFNGGNEEKYKGEERALVQSLQTAHFDENPEMKAEQITDRLLTELKSKKYDFLVANYANADMVGHSGNFQAVIQAVQFLDAQIGKIKEEVLNQDGFMIITGDHGNAEKMVDPQTGDILPKHTTNPVPFYLIGREYRKEKEEAEITKRKGEIKGFLFDVAPTILDLMKIPQPKVMDGQSLIPIVSG